jgi:hypothetical protein
MSFLQPSVLIALRTALYYLPVVSKVPGKKTKLFGNRAARSSKKLAKFYVAK